MIHPLSFIYGISGKSSDNFIEKKKRRKPLVVFNEQIAMYSLINFAFNIISVLGLYVSMSTFY